MSKLCYAVLFAYHDHCFLLHLLILLYWPLLHHTNLIGLVRCYKRVTQMLQRCYKGVTKVLQRRYEGLTPHNHTRVRRVCRVFGVSRVSRVSIAFRRADRVKLGGWAG
jgi:hypothetical protein